VNWRIFSANGDFYSANRNDHIWGCNKGCVFSS